MYVKDLERLGTIVKMPRPGVEVTTLLGRLVEADPRVLARSMFGQPSGFVNGRFCFGAFGPDLVLRLGDRELKLALALPGARPFEPMAGRRMSGYVVLPTSALPSEREAVAWARRAIEHAARLPRTERPRRPPRRRPLGSKRTRSGSA